MNPNEHQATQHGAMPGAALRDGPFFLPAALLLTYVQQGHVARNALQGQKNDLVAAPEFYVYRP